MIRRYCEVVRNMCPSEMTKEQIISKLRKWLKRGHPISTSNLCMFHNGYTSSYNTIEELAEAIKQVKASYFTIIFVDKEFDHEKK